MTTEIGTLQIAPVAIAVITAYLAVSGTGTLMVLARRDRNRGSPRTERA
ncbi:MAG TPA: hypothetical protein VFH80_29570 [Solirubrobacteraceae bacterium]|nr:hypothetical protein [Solirubrobacteraceae bacterium]